MRTHRIIFSSLALLVTPGTVAAATLYADVQLTSDCPTSYDPAARSCGSGTNAGYASLNAAAQAAKAGDVVVIRAAVFNVPFTPAVSGAPGAPITFKAADGETVTFTNISDNLGAIHVARRSYLAFEGLTVEKVASWARIENSNHVVFEGNHFSVATVLGTHASLKLLHSDDCVVRNNVFEDANDNIVVVDSNRNLIVGNDVTRGRHSLLSVRCSNANVFRGNVFKNPIQKAAEIYDCEGSSSDDPVLYNATHRNIFEGNHFAETAASTKDYEYNGVQFAGQDGIVRWNVFDQNLGGGLNVQVYPDEALQNHGNRIYNNTFYSNRCYGLASSNSQATSYYDNAAKNNLFFANTDCAGGGKQVSIGNPIALVFDPNAVSATDPGFVDSAMGDFHLLSNSPVLDTGGFLTVTKGAGSGMSLPVADARYFSDGGGIEGELGDLIQLDGGETTARITAIDLMANVLTLDAALSWSDGQGVSVRFGGAAPDPGAFEVGIDDPVGSGGAGPAGATSTASTSSTGSTGSTGSGLGSTGGGSTAGADDANGVDGGCSCRVGTVERSPWALVVLFALAFSATHYRRINRPGRRRSTSELWVSSPYTPPRDRCSSRLDRCKRCRTHSPQALAHRSGWRN